MIEEFVNDLIKKSYILTSAPGNGSTVVLLNVALFLLLKDNKVILYDSTGSIDRDFIKNNYSYLYNNLLFFSGNIKDLIYFIEYINYDFDYLLIDSADSLMSNKSLLLSLINLIHNKEKNIIVTSQIRVNPNNSQTYSTIENLNIKNNLFSYSVWIRNVTENRDIISSKYIDIYKKIRVGNDYIRRYIIKINTKTGVIIG